MTEGLDHPGFDHAELSYPEVGATRHGPLPGGYRHLRYRSRVGTGEPAMRWAAAEILQWRMHRGTGARVDASSTTATPGDRVTVSFGVGPLRVKAPCLVIWTQNDEHRAGFGYGTLPGHPAIGEESFVVEHEADDSVWLTITAFSRPGRLSMRLAGPVGPLLQGVYARRCGKALRRGIIQWTATV